MSSKDVAVGVPVREKMLRFRSGVSHSKAGDARIIGEAVNENEILEELYGIAVNPVGALGTMPSYSTGRLTLLVSVRPLEFVAVSLISYRATTSVPSAVKRTHALVTPLTLRLS